MTTFFSGQQVGIWGAQNKPILGTLTGTVTRTDATHVSLTGLSLMLSSSSVYFGTKILHFMVGGQINTLNITGGSTNLGTFSLVNTGVTVANIAKSATVTWRSSDNMNGGFVISFPPYPAQPTLEDTSKTAYSITVKYGVSSFGIGSTGTVTLKAGTSSDSLTAIDTYDQTGYKTFTYSGLNADTTYYFEAVATNSDNKSAASSTEHTTTLKDVTMYGSVDNWAKEIDKIYGSLNGQTKEIAKIYGSVSGVTKRIF